MAKRYEEGRIIVSMDREPGDVLYLADGHAAIILSIERFWREPTGEYLKRALVRVCVDEEE